MVSLFDPHSLCCSLSSPQGFIIFVKEKTQRNLNLQAAVGGERVERGGDLLSDHRVKVFSEFTATLAGKKHSAENVEEKLFLRESLQCSTVSEEPVFV